MLLSTSFANAQVRYQLEFGTTFTGEQMPLPNNSPGRLPVHIGWESGISINGGVTYPLSEANTLYAHLGYFQYRVTAQTGPFVLNGGQQAPFYQSFSYWDAASLEVGLNRIWAQRRRWSISGGIGLKYGINVTAPPSDYPRPSAVGLMLFDFIDWTMQYQQQHPHSLHAVPSINLIRETKRGHQWYLKFNYHQGLLPSVRITSGYVNLLGADNEVLNSYELEPFNLFLSYYGMHLGFTW